MRDYLQLYVSVLMTATAAVIGYLYVQVVDLNEKVAVVVTKVSEHDSMIGSGNAMEEHLSERVRELELAVQKVLDGQGG